MNRNQLRVRRTRDNFSIAKPRLRYAPPAVSLSMFSRDPVGDRRRYNPALSVAAPFATQRSAVRLVDRVVSRSILKPNVRSVIAFATPKKVAVCVRRHQRREVLMAKGVGGSRVRRPRRNEWSGVSC